ncbi:MAG: helix-turn-helix domain-containing protein [Candidatus Bathyarchaeota archaeon]|nr:helix-turn-helix domain-containing protein [Candidatus Bathyarchaeota archaeon]
MHYWEMENAAALSVTLKEAGFQVSQLCCSRPSCFNFAARKNDKTVLIKAHADVDTFSHQDAAELKTIASHASAASLIISQKTHDKPLEDDTVYSRHAISVVTEKTIKNIAFQTANPLVYAGPGGYFVEINGAQVEKRRKELGMSIGKLADMVGVSRRTLYGYERGMAKASVTTAYNLAKTLGIPVAKPINILEKTRKQHQCLLTKATRALTAHALLFKVFKKFAFCNISPIRKAPFDFIMNIPDEKHAIVGSIAASTEKHLSKRIEETLSICRVITAHPVLITEKPQQLNENIACVCANELSTMRTPKDLIANV